MSTPPAESSAAAADTGTERPRSRPALSPSRAGDFKQCPLLYRFRAVDRIPEAPSKAQLKGTLVHAALESLYGLPAQERVPDRAVSLVDPAWEHLLAESPDVAETVPAEERAAFLDEARTLIEGYYKLEDPTRFEPESCELRVETELDNGVLLRGFVDRIDVAPTGEVRVVDYKTGRAPREMTESKALFQMKFYALVLLRTRGIVPAQLRLIYLTDGEILTYAPDEAELLRFERTLSAIWKAILAAGQTGDFRPKPGRLCSWCDHKVRCPEFGGTPPPYPGWPESPADEVQKFEEIVE
ncbi:RecB family exonuclease [Rhodococcus sp. OK270]|uniref:RecB family exonuclease n=1 Tax=unclassified Rhodococcus (in: high G+C Gram-positive bacteria) TaxID=192944 RepID=UPI000BCDC420|nr:putative RecB family exonuclease [Rhodococcus sp. OK611]SNX88950.1 putative RecB family exonuclease [Rhodococcus sp. OK270]